MGAPPFDPLAALAALNKVSLQGCARPGGPTGAGDAVVAFHSSGEVTVVFVVDPTFRATDVGTCVAQALSTATVAPYLSGTDRVRMPFTVP